ncbi:MAG: TIGR03000 domain-containing protein [Gemmataceae bacterium]|nr:TIGR03000 domain-containing protein [Gemmataceae bacterium]MDW8266692.1 TIGR03000 domain-containing protein [Gemmataceae bacterium]
MYSLVMMMALTTGGETPAFCGRCGGGGCLARAGGCGRSCGCLGGLFSRRCGCNGCCPQSCCPTHHCPPTCGCPTHYVAEPHGCAAPHQPAPSTPPAQPMPMPEKKEGAALAPATLVVTLPAEAKLFIDGQATTSTSEVRTFETPALPLGFDYSYTLRAELVRDGQTLTQTKTVTVRGGAESRGEIACPEAVAAK